MTSEHECYYTYGYANSAGGYDCRCDVCGRLLFRMITFTAQRYRHNVLGQVVIEDLEPMTLLGPWAGREE